MSNTAFAEMPFIGPTMAATLGRVIAAPKRMHEEELYAQLLEQFEIVKERHEKFVEKGNKTAEADVRKALGEIKKLVTPYRKASVDATKK